MKFENIWENPKNAIGLFDREFAFITDENRPGFVRIRQEKLTLWLGQRGNKHVYDGEFVEAWSCKMEDRAAPWELVEKTLKPITITFKDW